MIYEAEKGEQITLAARKAIHHLQGESGERGILKFNDIEIPFYRNSNANDIAEKYMLMHYVNQLTEK